jgi:fermentation-respiration switch protein FrsA (DUF1100 family)
MTVHVDDPQAKPAKGWWRTPIWPKLAWTLWRVMRAFLVAYLVVLLVFLWLENSLIFFPTKYPGGDWNPAGLAFEDAKFRAADGTKLHGWYVPAEDPIAVVLFCHGNGGNLTHRSDLMEMLARQMNVSVLVFDYRGYGKSEGSPSEAGVLADARGARTWLAARTGLAEQDIVLMGESLGGAVAVDLAAKDGARALVLEDTFTSLPDMAALLYPWLPAKWFMRSRLDSLSLIGKYHGPLLMCHGDADDIIPHELGQRLFDAAEEPKTLLIDPGLNHNDPRTTRFYDVLGGFLRQHGKAPPKR